MHLEALLLGHWHHCFQDGKSARHEQSMAILAESKVHIETSELTSYE
jgi:hypothetical protein